MYLKFQRFNNNAWADYGRVTLPLKLIDTMTDNTTAAMGVTTYLKGTDYSLDVLPPGEIVRLNFGTKIWYLVVIDSSEINPHTLTEYKYHSYTVQELLCYFRETYVQTAFFTNGRYTLASFLERLIALSSCDYGIDISTADAYSTMLANWNSPDYQIASNALLDNLIKIGKSLQVRLKARINASNNIEIYAKKLKGNTVLSTLNGRKLSTVPQYKGANYAAKVVANVSNMANDVEAWFPADDPGFGIIPTPEDGSTTADADGIFIEVPFPIRKATQVRVAGKGTLVPTAIFQQGDWYDRFMNLVPPYSEALPAYVWENDNSVLTTENNYSGAYTTFNVVEQREWLLLDPDDTNNAPRHQQNTLYYKRGENKIYNIKICNGAGEDFDTDVAYTYVEGGVDYPKYQRLYYHMNRYVVYGNFYTTNDLVKTNGSTSNRTTIYSQSQNSVDGDELIKNMQDHIDSMQNQDLQESWQFESVDDVPEVGNIYNGMVISEIQLTIDNKINAVIQLSDELVPKSEYVSADGGLNLPAIPLDKSFDRLKTYAEKLWFCRTLTEANAKTLLWGAGEYINPSFKNKYFDTLTPSRNDKCYAAKEIRLETGNYESDVVYSALVPITYNLGTTLISTFKTHDNVSAGVVRSFVLGLRIGDVRYFNVPFVNSDGMSKEILMKGGISSSSQNESNYPALGSQSMNLGDWLFQIQDDNYHHDPAEIINNSYQLDYVVANKEDIISTLFLLNTSVLKETYGESATKAVLINTAYYAIQTYTETVISSSLIKISITVQGTFAPINGARVDFRIGSSTVLSMDLDVTEVDSNTRKIEFYIAYTKA